MAMQNLASKYSRSVDERFHRESQAMMALNNNYKFTGVQTVQVYSLPVVAMNDYQRTGSSRYGQANDLSTNVQTMTVKRDRAFTFIIDKGDKIQSQMVSDAGKALSRQLREVCVPEFDAYVFKTLAAAATARGAMSSEELTRDNAYSMFLAAMEHLGNHNVPDKGRVCFCSYRFANLLKQDPAFMKWGDSAQGEFQKADAALEIAQTYLGQLISLEQWAAEFGLSQAQFQESIRQWEAEFGLAMQQFQVDTDLAYGSATGVIPSTGQLTAESKKRLAALGEVLLAAGIMPDSSQMKAMDINESQAELLLDLYRREREGR